MHERIDNAQERARAIGLAYGTDTSSLLFSYLTRMLVIDLKPHDISTGSRKFWDLWVDPIITIDGAASTLLLIQTNLAAGTLAPFAEKRPELQILLDDILSFRVS